MIRFLRISAVLLLSFACSGKLFAQQDVELVNSSQVLFEGSMYYDMGKFNKAANLFKKVSRNDTNYAVSLIYLCYAYREDKEDSLCWVTAKKGIELESPYRADFYSFAGNALSEMKRFDEAIQTLDEAIKAYPYVYLFYHDKGVAYYEQKKFKEAESSFQQCIVINPFHAESHYYLGKCALDQGRTVPALLSFETYLIMTGNSERAAKTVVTIEDVYKNDYEFDPDTKLDPSETGDACFDDLLEVITSGIAMRPGYKNTTGIGFSFVKVRQAMFESMTYKENTGNWWMEHYIPFYLELQKQGHFIAFNYMTLGSISDASVQKGYKKNKKKIRAFAVWVNEYFAENSKHPATDIVKEKADADILFYENRMVLGVGQRNPVTKKAYGEWTYFYASSGLVLAKGTFDAQGKMQGEWVYYHPNGTVREKSNYRNDVLEGLSEFWYDNGERRTVMHYTAGKLNGEFEEYSFHGGLETRGNYLNGKPNGPITIYHDNDAVQYETSYLNGKLNGDLRSYYNNGKVASEVKLTAGKKNGPAKDYYRNGTLQSEGAYKNDMQSGTWKEYYSDGQLAREGTYKTPGKREGVWKEYHRNGKLVREASYKAGLLNGVMKEYAETGELVNERVYKSDKLVKATYYNLKGKVLAEYNITKARTEVKEYYPDGTVAAEGDYLDGKRDGQWTMYSENGGWKIAHINYYDDEYDGRMKYYHANGKVMFETTYKMGVEHGYRKSFYLNGEIESEGWVQSDMKQGDWYEYNERAIMTSHTYYLNDEQYGTQEFFDARGKRREEIKVKRGVVVERNLYDSTGTVEYTLKMPNGTGTFKAEYKNGTPWVDIAYHRGFRNGTYRYFDWNGRVTWEADYFMGRMNGVRKMYYQWDNQLFNESAVVNGELEGKSIGWWENGQKRWEENYVEGDKEGEQKYYHENGQLQRVGVWHEDEADGEVKIYSPDGMLICVRYYRMGVLLGYSYEGADGNLVEMKPFEDATGKFECFYRNGKKSIEGEFANGQVHGRWVEYYSDGTVKEEENFNYGDFDGEQKRYFPDGKIEEVEHYYFGALDGECRYYYPNGNLKRVEYYTLDDEWSRWYFYNENGQLTATRLFYAGVQQDEVVVPVAPPAPASKSNTKPKAK